MKCGSVLVVYKRKQLKSAQASRIKSVEILLNVRSGLVDPIALREII